MTAQLLSGIVAMGLSLILSYVPGLAPRWKALPASHKSAWTGVGILVSALAVYGLACQGIIPDMACPDVYVLAGSIFAALVANQGIYGVTKNLHRAPKG